MQPLTGAQHVVLWVTLAVAAIALLVPPWADWRSGGSYYSYGYSFLFTAPNPRARIDTSRLAVELAAIACTGGVVGLFFGKGMR